tara:strand:+ start:101 stop:595 length:495 start_codon:yes stop_codon:yes gene_type:complete
MTTTRPTFEYNGQPVRAAGLLICTENDGNTHYLLRQCKNKWSDIGGKTDLQDKDVLATIVREVTEETNCHLFSTVHNFEQAYEMLDLILRNEQLEVFYLKKSKYLMVKVVLDNKIRKLPMKRFGLFEHHDSMQHYYKWITNVNRHNCHPRLRFSNKFNNIFNIV